MEPSARALPQRVEAELSDSRRTCTPRRGANSAQRSSKTRRACRCNQLCTASRNCAAAAPWGSPTCKVRRGTPGSEAASLCSTAPVTRGSTITITVSPRKGMVVPSFQSTRAWASRRARSCCSCSLRRIQRDFSRKAASTSPTPTQRGALTVRPSGPMTKPMLRRRARRNSNATRCPSSSISRSARGWAKDAGAKRSGAAAWAGAWTVRSGPGRPAGTWADPAVRDSAASSGSPNRDNCRACAAG